MSPLLREFDCLVDLRSTEYEHWTYNHGMAQLALKARAEQRTQIRTTRALAGLLQRLGVDATARLEWPGKVGGRLTKLLMREILAAVEVLRAVLSSRKVLVLHAHPLGLFLAWPLLFLFGGRFTICLHNDFVTTLRQPGGEQRVERWLWWCVAHSHRKLTFIAQNKHYGRFIKKFLPRTTPVIVCPHPITPRAVYEQVATEVSASLPARFDVGFFGRVESGRGTSAFEGHVDRHPAAAFLVAGKGASHFPSRPNVHRFELPPTDVYCALVTRADALFIDLRSDVYRIGESGVYWDAVSLDVSLLCGVLPRMYRARVREHFGDRAVRMARTE